MRAFFYRAAAMSVAAFVLSGCGMPQTISTPVAQAALAKHSLQRASKSNALLYVSIPATNSVFVFTYPEGALVQELTGFDEPTGVCSDSYGNVWITNGDNGNGHGFLVEYAHGGSNAIATLKDPNNAPQACSVDLITGDLAVANVPVGVKPNIAVYVNAKGRAKYYGTTRIANEVRTVAYGASSNIYFADSRGHTGWLPAGSSHAMSLDLSPTLRTNGPMQWDGLELAVLTSVKGQSQIWRYAVKENAGERGGIVKLKGAVDVSKFWIYDSGLAASGSLGIWLFKYPAGGSSTYLIKQAVGAVGVAVSQSP